MNRDEIIGENLGLVHACAKRFKNKGIEYDDLFAAGCEGLIKAVDRFNPDLGLQLSTYAVPVILGEIKRLFRDGGTVKVSRGLKELGRKINAAARTFTNEYGKEPTVNQLAEILQTEPQQIVQGINAAACPLSLTPVNDFDKRQIDIPAESYEDKLTDLLSLRQVINKLSVQDKQLINLRFFKGKTQSETGKILNMTQVQVSRKEKKILHALKEKLLA